MKKKNKKKGESWVRAKKNFELAKQYGLPENKFIELAKRTGNNVDQALELYHKGRKTYATPPDILEYLSHVGQTMLEDKNDELQLYFPLFKLNKIEIFGDVTGVFITSLYDWTFELNGYKHQFIKGEKNIMFGNELVNFSALTIHNKTKDKLYTKFTDFEKIEHEKVVEKTKIVKQVVNKDQSNKLDKIKKKIKHVLDKSYVHEDIKAKILNCFK